MTKRFGNFSDNSTKKLKTNIDDLWGDDLDDKDVNSFLLLATQVCEEKVNLTQQNDVSILPSYNGFKQTTNEKKFTSTQSNTNLLGINLHPSTSKIALATNKNGQCTSNQNGFKRARSFDSPEQSKFLELKVKKLQEDYIAKEGEISILRTQLKDIRRNNEDDMWRKEKDWNEKLTLSSKQLNAVKSELEFKNLEIANLKRKVVEVAKLNNLDASFNGSQSPYFKQPKAPESKGTSSAKKGPIASDRKISNNSKSFRIQPAIERYCPLKYAIPSSIFTLSKEENYLIDIKNKHMYRNTIPFLQNQISQEIIERIVRLQPKVTLLDNNKQLGLDYIHYEISELIKYDSQEINNVSNIPHFNKILMVSEQLLHNLHQFLLELERYTEKENSEDVNITHLETNFKGLALNNSAFSARKWCEGEMGISVRQTIALIAEILPYNDYFKQYLLNQKSLTFNENEEILKCLPVIQPKLDRMYVNRYDYLQLINSVVTIICKLKSADNFPGLLSSSTILLNKIILCWKLNDSCEEFKTIVENISREILFSHPNIQVLINYVEFLKNFPCNYRPLKFCLTSPKKVLKINQKEKSLQYSKDACFIQVLCVFLEDSILKVKNLQFYLNIVQAIVNIIKHDEKWLYYQEDKYCDCLCKIVKLCGDVIYQTVELFCEWHRSELGDALLIYRKIFRNGLRVFRMLSDKAYDLIVKYIATYSHYTDVITSLLKHKDVLNLNESEVEILEDLYMTEDMPTPDETLLDTIPIWN